jgi:hypothetical protein
MGTEIVVLHSSPPHQQRETTTTPPSLQYVPNSSASDNISLPSISKLWTKWDPRSKGRSTTSPLPHNANLRFQSVSTLVGRKELSIEKEVVEEVQTGPAKASTKSGRSKAIKEVGNGTKPKKARAKSKTEKAEDTAKEAKPKAKRKIRAKAAALDEGGTVSSHFSQNIEVKKADDPTKEAKPKAKRKSKAKSAALVEEGTHSHHFDQNVEAQEQDISETIKKAAAPATKKRKRKDADETEQEKPKAYKRAAKDGSANAPKPRKKTGTTSTHFGCEENPRDGKAQDNDKAVTPIPESFEPANLAEKRRKSWTPVKDTVQAASAGRDVFEVPSSSQPPTPISSKTDFRSMLGSFGFNGTSQTPRALPEKAAAVGLNKRRRIEVCHEKCLFWAMLTIQLLETTTLAPKNSKDDTPGPRETKPMEVKIAKKKSPKKPAFSITAKVTAKYGQPAIAASEKTSVFFAPCVELPVTEASSAKKTSPTKKAPTARPKGPPKPQAPRKASEEGAKTTKTKAKVTKPKKVVPGGQKLLSPSGIASRAQQQVVMFGTSSQLLTGDSPQTLRQLQQALRESESMFAIQEEPTSTAPIQRRLARGIRHTSGKMWAQQAENFDENTADLEDLPDTADIKEPELAAIVEEMADSYGPPSAIGPSADFMLLRFTEDVFQTLSDEIDGMDSLEPVKEVESPNSQEPEAGGFVQGQPTLEEQEDSHWNMIEDSSHLGSRAESPRIELRQSPSPTPRTVTLSSSPDRPAHSAMRTAMAPAMLSQPSLFIPPPPLSGRTALRPLSTNTKSPKKAVTTNKGPAKSTKTATADTTGSPKRKRGRPPKAKTSDEAVKDKSSKSALSLQSTPTKATRGQNAEDKWHTLDEIEDSDPDMTPSPRRRSKKAPPSPLPDLVTTTKAVTKRVNGVLANANHPQWPEIQAKLFPDITLAVKGQPRSSGGQKLTWYEKMLLYDPIVIEDLTAFINGEGLRTTIKEKEEEVRGWMVQKWCEENSVCCLWKEGLSGRVKTKY